MKLKLFSIIIFAISLNALELSESLLMDMSRTYGYVTSQSLVAEKLKKKYPEVRQELTKAQLEFDLKFKPSVDNIKKAFGTEWQEYQDMMNPTLIEQVNKVNLDLSKNWFAKEISERAKGNIETPVIETLLMFNPEYQKYPKREFTDGFKKQLHSRNTSKSKGIDFHIDVPQSWKVIDAKRPNTLWLATYQNGYFDEDNSQVSLGVVIKELPAKINTITQQEAQEFCNEELKDTPIKECVKITLENLPAIYARNTKTLQRLRSRFTIEVANYFIFYNDRMIILQGAITNRSDTLSKKQLNKKFDKYLPLFDQIANSLVINDLYTNKERKQTQYHSYKLFNNRFQAVFPDKPSTQEIPKELLDPKNLLKSLPYEYAKDLTQAQLDKVLTDAIEKMKNNQAYFYSDKTNKISYTAHSGSSGFEHKNYLWSGLKDMLDTQIENALKADNRTLIDLSSTLDKHNDTYIAIYTSSYLLDGQKVYASTKEMYQKDKTYRWRVSYVDKEDKRIFDEYQYKVKVLK